MGLITTYNGRGAAIMAAVETVYGTAVTPRTHSRPVVTMGLGRQIPDFKRLGLNGNGGMPRGAIRSADQAGGGWTMECTYGNMGLWLHNLLGASATAGGGPYTNTYTIADTLPLGLTLEALRGDDNSELFEGCKLNSATFSCSPGGVLMMNVGEVIGETSAARSASPSTVSYGTDSPSVVEHSHAGQCAFNAVNYDLMNFSLTVNNGLVRRPYLGSLLTKEPLRQNVMSVSGTITIEVVDTLYAAFTAKTESNLGFGFTSGTDQFNFLMHNCRLASVSGPVQGPGVIQETFQIDAYSDGTNHGLQIEVINDNASEVGN